MSSSLPSLRRCGAIPIGALVPMLLMPALAGGCIKQFRRSFGRTGEFG
jgi:hypothetical protein